MTAGRPKRHSASFRRVLVLVYGTVILFALLITGIYTVVSPQIFASNKISDLIPKGQIIAGYIESTLRGELSSTYLVPLIGRSTSQWEATVWVVDASGDTLIRTQQIEGRRVGRLPAKLSESMLPQVLSGEVATHVGSMEDLTVSDGASHRKSTSFYQYIDQAIGKLLLFTFECSAHQIFQFFGSAVKDQCDYRKYDGIRCAAADEPKNAVICKVTAQPVCQRICDTYRYRVYAVVDKVF